jgi:hypothetical protein
VDLYPVPLITPTLPAGSGAPISVSLVAQLNNRGNTLAGSVPVRFAQYDYASGQLLARDLITVSQVLARYGGVQPRVSHSWLLTSATVYTLTFESGDLIAGPAGRHGHNRVRRPGLESAKQHSHTQPPGSKRTGLSAVAVPHGSINQAVRYAAWLLCARPHGLA